MRGRHPRILLALGLAVLGGALAAPAGAILGQPVATARRDQARMRGQMTALTRRGYAIAEIKGEDGMVVREFVAPNGMVFGVAWKGPFMPNLRALLGDYFARYAAAAQAAQASRRRGPLSLRLDDLVVAVAGHMRAFRGLAVVPSLLPNGVTAEEVRP